MCTSLCVCMCVYVCICPAPPAGGVATQIRLKGSPMGGISKGNGGENGEKEKNRL